MRQCPSGAWPCGGFPAGVVARGGLGENPPACQADEGFRQAGGDEPRVTCWSALPQADRLLACHTAGSTAAARAVSTALSTDRRRPPPTPPAFPPTVTSPGTGALSGALVWVSPRLAPPLHPFSPIHVCGRASRRPATTNGGPPALRRSRRRSRIELHGDCGPNLLAEARPLHPG